MSHDPSTGGADALSVLASAVERHLGWARDFAVAGDIDSAIDAIRDAHSTVAEMHASSSSDCGRAASL